MLQARWIPPSWVWCKDGGGCLTAEGGGRCVRARCRGGWGRRQATRPPGCEACFLLYKKKGGILIHLSPIKSVGSAARSPRCRNNKPGCSAQRKQFDFNCNFKYFNYMRFFRLLLKVEFSVKCLICDAELFCYITVKEKGVIDDIHLINVVFHLLFCSFLLDLVFSST